MTGSVGVAGQSVTVTVTATVDYLILPGAPVRLVGVDGDAGRRRHRTGGAAMSSADASRRSSAAILPRGVVVGVPCAARGPRRQPVAGAGTSSSWATRWRSSSACSPCWRGWSGCASWSPSSSRSAPSSPSCGDAADAAGGSLAAAAGSPRGRAARPAAGRGGADRAADRGRGSRPPAPRDGRTARRRRHGRRSSRRRVAGGTGAAAPPRRRPATVTVGRRRHAVRPGPDPSRRRRAVAGDLRAQPGSPAARRWPADEPEHHPRRLDAGAAGRADDPAPSRPRRAPEAAPRTSPPRRSPSSPATTCGRCPTTDSSVPGCPHDDAAVGRLRAAGDRRQRGRRRGPEPDLPRRAVRRSRRSARRRSQPPPATGHRRSRRPPRAAWPAPASEPVPPSRRPIGPAAPVEAHRPCRRRQHAPVPAASRPAPAADRAGRSRRTRRRSGSARPPCCRPACSPCSRHGAERACARRAPTCPRARAACRGGGRRAPAAHDRRRRAAGCGSTSPSAPPPPRSSTPTARIAVVRAGTDGGVELTLTGDAALPPPWQGAGRTWWLPRPRRRSSCSPTPPAPSARRASP